MLPLQIMKHFQSKHIYIIVAIILIIATALAGIRVYRLIFAGNVANNQYLYIHSDASFSQVLDSIYTKNILKDTCGFKQLAQKKNYPSHIHAGKYKISVGMSNNDIVNMLRSGKQEPVKLTFNNIRTKQQLAQRIAQQLECSAEDLLSLLQDNDFWQQYDLNTENCMVVFLPNTYEFWWNTSAEAFIHRMYQEYTRYWNSSRTALAESIPLTPVEVSILASIVEEENHLKTEQPTIAGLYLNRLYKNMPLQSDPTLKFALGDFTIQRILNQDKQIDSPYNTYTHTGLPPGPIRIPSLQAIEAVLHYEKHNYVYMCAKDDFSGRHNFSTNLAEHNRYAALYHAALNRQKIIR